MVQNGRCAVLSILKAPTGTALEGFSTRKSLAAYRRGEGGLGLKDRQQEAECVLRYLTLLCSYCLYIDTEYMK